MLIRALVVTLALAAFGYAIGAQVPALAVASVAGFVLTVVPSPRRILGRRGPTRDRE